MKFSFVKILIGQPKYLLLIILFDSDVHFKINMFSSNSSSSSSSRNNLFCFLKLEYKRWRLCLSLLIRCRTQTLFIKYLHWIQG